MLQRDKLPFDSEFCDCSHALVVVLSGVLLDLDGRATTACRPTVPLPPPCAEAAAALYYRVLLFSLPVGILRFLRVLLSSICTSC